MFKELPKTLEDAINNANSSGEIDQPNADQIWKKVAQIYRLRVHDGFLIETEKVVNFLGKIVAEKYPIFGKGLNDSLTTILSDDSAQRELFQEILPQMNIDIMTPATAKEEQIFNLITEKRSFEEFDTQTKKSILEYLEN